MVKKRSTKINTLVVLSSCGNTVGKVVDLDRLSNTLEQYPEVVKVIRDDGLCHSGDYQKLMTQVKAAGADRVVIAGCTPRTHEDTLRPTETKEDLPSLGPYLIEQVGIREQCEWVHSDTGEATNKALWLISGAIGKLTTAEDLIKLESSQLVFNKDIAVIGGGIAGIRTALDLAEGGLKVHIIEREAGLGGRAYKHFLDEADKKLLPDISTINDDPNIDVRLETEVVEITGGMGRYTVALSNNESIQVGGIAVATGSALFDADRIAEYRYTLPQVLTSFDLNKLLAEQDEGLKVQGITPETPRNIHFIQCVGSRDENYNPYCNLICCTVAVKQSLELKKRLPDANIYVHYMDMRGPYQGFEEKFIEAQNAGVVFSRGRVGDIISADQGVILRGESIELAEVFEWPADLVILSVGHEPSKGVAELSNMLFFPVDRDSFNVEHNYHIDLKDRRGVAFVGCAQGPRFIRHSLADARRAAFEFIEFFGERELSRDVRSVINEARCAGCGTCVELCPYSAITLNSVYDYDRYAWKRVAVVDINTCQGCGACAAGCPSGVPTLYKYSTEQIWKQIEEMI